MCHILVQVIHAKMASVVILVLTTTNVIAHRDSKAKTVTYKLVSIKDKWQVTCLSLIALIFFILLNNISILFYLTDNCASNPCLLNSTCTNLVNDFSCKCTPGYSGKTCSQRSDLCSNAKCNMGTCVPNNQQDTYTCSCDVGRAYSK